MATILTLVFLFQVTILVALSRIARTINCKLERIKMNQSELAQALNDASTQIQKGIDEVLAAVQNSGNVTPEVEAALASLKSKAQALDDINPDA